MAKLQAHRSQFRYVPLSTITRDKQRFYMNKLERYVGRTVRLNKLAFNEIVRCEKRPDQVLENYFLVAAVSKQMRKLICYGANARISVGIADVVLI